nr:immunoglobulin light chain junction region [Macaca mulatta]MOW42948.1 immunoglobulin light chain junction region [Macaca mulatta]
CQQDSDWSLSF